MPHSLEIVNSTDHIVKGEVTYMTIFCASNYFFVKPNSKWRSEKRGICPIVEVSVEIKTPRGIFTAKPFISVGTSHGRFEVVELKENIFKVVKMKNAETNELKTFKTYKHTFLDQR